LVQTFCHENFIQRAAHLRMHRIWHPWTFGSSEMSKASRSGNHSKHEKNFSTQFNVFGTISIRRCCNRFLKTDDETPKMHSTERGLYSVRFDFVIVLNVHSVVILRCYRVGGTSDIWLEGLDSCFVHPLLTRDQFCEIAVIRIIPK
jgi:hypothetical protein